MNANNVDTTKPALTQAQYKALYNAPLLTDFTVHTYLELMHILRCSRPWFSRESSTHDLHPAIQAIIESLNPYRHHDTPIVKYIKDWREMMLEWAHISKEQPHMIAYTRDDSAGQRDIQTRTSLGKYIKRHCPDAPDHVVRDFVAMHDVAAGSIEIVHSMEEMIEAVQNGPSSCMQDDSFDRWEHHPYEVYSPDYGWHMAVRTVNGKVMGRCLLNETDGFKCFVRSYRSTEGNSPTDEAIEAWLATQGYTKRRAWTDGLKLSKLHSHGDTIMAYLDGDTKRVSESTRYFTVDSCGEYEADNSNGYLGAHADMMECECCGDECEEDDMTYVPYTSQHVCSSCLDYSYVYVTGRMGRTYYVHEDDAVQCESDGEQYHSVYLEENEIRYIDNDSEGYYKLEDLWFCEERGEYYRTDDVEPVDVDGVLTHPDDVEEEDEEESEDDTETSDTTE